MNSYKLHKLQISSPRMQLSKEKKLFTPRATDPLSSNPNSLKSPKLQLLRQQKSMLVKICNQLIQTNQQLTSKNSAKLQSNQNMKHEIDALEKRLEEMGERHEKNKWVVEQEFQLGKSQVRVNSLGSGVEGELKNLRVMLEGIGSEQMIEFKMMSSRYKDLELEIRSAKRQIEKKKGKTATARGK